MELGGPPGFCGTLPPTITEAGRRVLEEKPSFWGGFCGSPMSTSMIVGGCVGSEYPLSGVMFVGVPIVHPLLVLFWRFSTQAMQKGVPSSSWVTWKLRLKAVCAKKRHWGPLAKVLRTLSSQLLFFGGGKRGRGRGFPQRLHSQT